MDDNNTEESPDLGSIDLGIETHQPEETPESIETNDLIEGNPEPLSGLEPGTAWGTDPKQINQSEKKLEQAQAEATPLDVDSITDDQFDELVMSRFGIKATSKDGFKSLREQLKEQKSLIEELQSRQQGSGGNERITELEAKLKEFQSLDQIRNSTAWQQEIMKPQAEALTKARQIGQQAGVEQSDIDQIFSASNEFEANRILDEMGNPTLARMLGSQVTAAFSAKAAAEAAMQSENPVAQLDQWMARSQEMQQQQGAQANQQFEQLESVGIDLALQDFQETSMLGKNPGIPAIVEQLKADMKNNPLTTPEEIAKDYGNGKIAAAMLPRLEKVLEQNLREINELKSQLAATGAAIPTNKPSTPPRAQAVPAGRLPAGSAWG